MQVVILGEKNKKGEYQVVQFYPTQDLRFPVNIGETITVDEVSPFPFENFSSVNETPKGWKRTYLLVDADMTKEEWEGMKSSGVMYHRFKNRKITFIKEFKTPFQYSLETFKKFNGRLQMWELTTWILHQKTRSKKEHDAMSEILELAYQYHSSSQYKLDISIDKYVIPYLKQLLSYDSDNVTFGRYGSIDYRLKTMKLISDELTVDEFIDFILRVYISGSKLVNVIMSLNYSLTDKSYILSREEVLRQYPISYWGMLFFEELDNPQLLIELEAFDDIINSLIRLELDNQFRYSPFYDYEDKTKDVFYWLEKKDVPLYEPEETDDDLYWDDYDDYYDYYDDYYNEEERSFEEEYDDYIEEEPVEPYDIRLDWLDAVIPNLNRFLTLEEIRDKMIFVHEDLWKQWVSERYIIEKHV